MMRIEELEAGPRLDALVAKTMFSCSSSVRFFGNRIYGSVIEVAICQCAKMQHGDSESPIYGELPGYSEDIAAAWQVDKDDWAWEFEERPFGLDVTLYPSEAVYRLSQQQYPVIPQGVRIVRVLWDTVSDKATAYCLARCRAALLACGITEVPDND